MVQPCAVDNAASATVLEKSDLVREGRLRRYIVHPNVSDEPRDVYLYARTRPLLASMRAQHVLIVLDALADRRLPAWVAGGWGMASRTPKPIGTNRRVGSWWYRQLVPAEVEPGRGLTICMLPIVRAG